jgi:membrane protease YdiL (CAAX protease family)
VAPRWPAWYAGVGFVVALVLTAIAVGVLAAATGVSEDEESALFTIVATLVQDSVFVGTALVFASLTARPRLADFGLRRTRFWPALGWAVLALVSFYVFAAVYAALVQNQPEQDVVESLGADEGTLGLIVAGFMVIVVAPVAEEFFFRGFFYRALRTRFAVFTAAALDGLLFGLLHFNFEARGLLIIPPLAVLGFAFCLVYERTGSLYPVIALHAFNNAIAYGVQAETWEVSLVLGLSMLIGTAAVPRLAHPRVTAPALR